MADEENKKGLGFWTLPLLVSILAIGAALLATPHRELDWHGTVVPLARSFYQTQNDTSTPLEGKIVVITGCTSGIGRALTKAVSKLGATVVGIGRSRTKLEALQAEVSTVKTFRADLDDLESVSQAANEILQEFDTLDVLINNAGMHDAFTNLMGNKVSKQGYDQVFAVNYLSHFLLTEKLSKAMQRASKPVILQIASSFHFEVDGSDLRVPPNHPSKMPIAAQKGGNPGMAILRSSRSYSNSKLAQILHARALKRRHPLWKDNQHARIVSVCPGVVATNIAGAAGRFGNTAMSTGFPVDGWGIASPLIALFSEKEKGDFFTNSAVFERGQLVNFLQHPLFYQLMIRDAVLWTLIPLIAALQHTRARVASQESSLESYNETLAESLYDWSLDAIQDYL